MPNIMPVYSIQKDPAWVPKPQRGSSVPPPSVYSDDDDTYDARVLDHPDMPSIPPLRIQKSYHPSYHAHPEQNITDDGPQVRQSRLPIFKQVRSMLHKPPASKASGNKAKDDQFSGDTGKAAHVQPATYKSPYEGAFQVVRDRRSPTRLQKKPPKSVRSMSPVSVLREEAAPPSPDQSEWEDDDGPPSPVSPVSEVSPDYYQIPVGRTHMSGNEYSLPETPCNTKAVTRKSVPSRYSLSPENIPPQSRDSNISDIQETSYRDPKSHFSWTTYAPSVAPTRPSLETSGNPRHSKQPSGEVPLQSRFSWSTVNTTMTNQIRPDSPPPSPPPPVPSKFKTLPVQSILSRHRPIQRADREIWTPPPRKTSLADPNTNTPLSARTKLNTTFENNYTTTTSGKKQLPPPPELLTPISPMSHLETLLAAEQDKIHQRKNILKLIEELEKKEKASPLEVSFSELREAKKKLEEYRKTLAEIQLEEREIGIAIARARRKEGEEEGLWVRRVTG